MTKTDEEIVEMMNTFRYMTKPFSAPWTPIDTYYAGVVDAFDWILNDVPLIKPKDDKPDSLDNWSGANVTE